MKIPTPHNTAKYGDLQNRAYARRPLARAVYRGNFLENAVLVNNVRGINGWTGFYKGKRVSVMASGMGMPSIAIYAHELFDGYGVETIIRVGSAGGLADDVKLRDVILAQAACTNSAFARSLGLPGDYAPIGDFCLLKKPSISAKN